MSPRAFQGRYSPEPQNTSDALDAQIDDRVQQFIQSAQFTGIAVPQSIPQQTVIRPVVTDLPTTATDGDEVRFVADSANGVVWLLRYRDSGNAYPWEFLGGSPLYAEVTTSESTTSATYGDLATLGPSIALPLAGDYMIRLGAALYNNTSAADAWMSYDADPVAAADADGVHTTQPNASVASVVTHATRERRKTGLGVVSIIAKYRASSGTATFLDRYLSITPVRLGAS